jgi:hypothetical protein
VTRLVTALWRGDMPLAKTFWEYLVVYGALLNAAGLLAFLILLTQDQALLGMIVHSIPTPYNVLVFVAVWRSAGKYQGRRDFATAARAVAAVFLITTFVF